MCRTSFSSGMTARPSRVGSEVALRFPDGIRPACFDPQPHVDDRLDMGDATGARVKGLEIKAGEDHPLSGGPNERRAIAEHDAAASPAGASPTVLQVMR